MDIKKITGVTQSEEITLTKGIANLVVMSDSDIANLNDERISVWIEKKDGTIDICRGAKLKDFLILGTYGQDAMHTADKDGTEYYTCANVELTEDEGYIELYENENIKIKLTDLDSGAVYELVGLEGFEPSKNIRRYERKVISKDVTSQDYDLRGYDVMCIQKDSSIEEFDIRMSNGATVKMTPFDMEQHQKSIDPLTYYKRMTLNNGVGNVTVDVPMADYTDRIVFPLDEVDSITVRKNAGVNAIDLHLRIDMNDYQQYGHHLQD